MPVYTVVLQQDDRELPVGVSEAFRSTAEHPQFDIELLNVFSEHGGIPRSGAGWTHMHVYEGYVGGKNPVPADTTPARSLSRDEVADLQRQHFIHFEI